MSGIADYFDSTTVKAMEAELARATDSPREIPDSSPAPPLTETTKQNLRAAGFIIP